MTPRRTIAWMGGLDGDASSLGGVFRFCMWITLVCIGSDLLILVVGVIIGDARWSYVGDLAGDIGLYLLAGLAATGWNRVQALEAQRTEMARKVAAAKIQAETYRDMWQTNLLRGK